MCGFPLYSLVTLRPKIMVIFLGCPMVRFRSSSRSVSLSNRSPAMKDGVVAVPRRIAALQKRVSSGKCFSQPRSARMPLARHALRHGISRRADAGLLVVSARREGDTLVVSVRDDGPGLTGGRRNRREWVWQTRGRGWRRFMGSGRRWRFRMRRAEALWRRSGSLILRFHDARGETDSRAGGGRRTAGASRCAAVAGRAPGHDGGGRKPERPGNAAGAGGAATGSAISRHPDARDERVRGAGGARSGEDAGGDLRDGARSVCGAGLRSACIGLSGEPQRGAVRCGDRTHARTIANGRGGGAGGPARARCLPPSESIAQRTGPNA